MRRDWVHPLLGFTALAILFAPDAAVGDGVFWHHDLRHHHLPWRSWAAQVWSEVRVPWWAPGAANGFPLLAEGQGGFLYPPTMLLFVLLPDALALNWAILGHLVLAAMGAWSLARSEGLRSAAGAMAGVAYGFGGFIVSHTLYLGMQNAMAWLPWALVGTRTGRPWLVAAAVGMMGLAGHPQAAAFGGAIVAAHAVIRKSWSALAGVAGGVLVASPQIAASLELSRFSGRDGGVGELFAGIGAMPIQELVGLVLPMAFGLDRPADIAQTYYHRGEGYWGAGANHWEMCVYAGVPVAVCAVAGVRRARGWAVLALVSILLMVGGPLWELLRHLPGFGYFRFPVRWAMGLSLALAMMAAHGVEVLRRIPRDWVVRWRIHFVAAMFTIYTGLAFWGLDRRQDEVAARLTGHFARQVAPPPPAEGLGPLARAALPAPEPEDPTEIPGKVARILADLRESTSPLSPRVLWPVLFLMLSAAWVRSPRLLVLVAAFDLWLFGHNYHPRVLREETERRPRWLAEIMTTPGGGRTTVLDRRVDPALDSELLTSSMGLPLGTSDVILPSPLFNLRNEAMLAIAGLDVGDRGARKVGRYIENLDVARRMGVRFLASVHEIPGLLPLVRGGTVNAYADPGALPRARVVPCVIGVADVDAAFAAVRDADPAQSVVIEGGTTGCAEGGSAELTAYRDDAVTIRATGPGTLVLADTWYPGWQASVDAVPAEILRADVLFRGVALPAGEHEVQFRYLPGKLSWLLGLSTTTLLACAAMAVRNRGR